MRTYRFDNSDFLLLSDEKGVDYKTNMISNYRQFYLNSMGEFIKKYKHNGTQINNKYYL